MDTDMTKDIEETRKLNSQKAQVEAAVNDLKKTMAKQEVSIGISALMSYMCALAYHSGYPLEKLVAYMTGLYQMHKAKNK
jgi:peptide methionine sulfoxide reductase MsrA